MSRQSAYDCWVEVSTAVMDEGADTTDFRVNRLLVLEQAARLREQLGELDP
jgi:hypothetical protein